MCPIANLRFPRGSMIACQMINVPGMRPKCIESIKRQKSKQRRSVMLGYWYTQRAWFCDRTRVWVSPENDPKCELLVLPQRPLRLLTANLAESLHAEGRYFDFAQTKNAFFPSSIDKVVALKHHQTPFRQRSPAVNGIFGVYACWFHGLGHWLHQQALVHPSCFLVLIFALISDQESCVLAGVRGFSRVTTERPLEIRVGSLQP